MAKQPTKREAARAAAHKANFQKGYQKALDKEAGLLKEQARIAAELANAKAEVARYRTMAFEQGLQDIL